MELNWSGKALVVTLLFRLLFGGYLAGMDQYGFNDVDSALTVLSIYGLIGVFAALSLLGKSYALKGMIGLEVIFIVSQSVFTLASFSRVVDPGLHDPFVNWWAMLLMFLFSLLTIIFSVGTYRETILPRAHVPKLPINS